MIEKNGDNPFPNIKAIDVYIRLDLETERVRVTSNPRTGALIVLGMLDAARHEILKRRDQAPPREEQRPIPETTRKQ
jgi:hypothetical protein